MKILFLGTRGEIEPKSKSHRMHTSTLLLSGRSRMMLDCGTSWLGKLDRVRPHHIILTHAHPDHAEGLKKGAPCPVWATEKTWELIDHYPIAPKQRRWIFPRKKEKIGSLHFEAFELLHSLRCPAVGYRISQGRKHLFYAPDVAWIEKMEEAFRGIQLYIGDGASIHRNMIRRDRKTGEIFGHATVRQQLTWCQKKKVPKMIVTHCGSGIVTDRRRAKKKIASFARERDVEVEVAFDGMELTF